MKLKEFIKKLRTPVEIELTMNGQYLCRTNSLSSVLDNYMENEIHDMDIGGIMDSRSFRGGAEIDLYEEGYGTQDKDTEQEWKQHVLRKFMQGE